MNTMTNTNDAADSGSRFEQLIAACGRMTERAKASREAGDLDRAQRQLLAAGRLWRWGADVAQRSLAVLGGGRSP